MAFREEWRDGGRERQRDIDRERQRVREKTLIGCLPEML